jgi:hypothetical protein
LADADLVCQTSGRDILLGNCNGSGANVTGNGEFNDAMLHKVNRQESMIRANVG